MVWECHPQPSTVRGQHRPCPSRVMQTLKGGGIVEGVQIPKARHLGNMFPWTIILTAPSKTSQWGIDPAEDAQTTQPSWQPSSHAGACSSAHWGGWHCCSDCGCSRSPSGRHRSALQGPAQTSLQCVSSTPAQQCSARPCRGD